eukprot:3130844-Pyramimonas_sp.AAC.1
MSTRSPSGRHIRPSFMPNAEWNSCMLLSGPFTLRSAGPWGSRVSSCRTIIHPNQHTLTDQQHDRIRELNGIKGNDEQFQLMHAR